MPATIAIKMPGAKARGYWGLAGSIYAKAVFHVDADAHTTVAEVKAQVAAAQSVKAALEVKFAENLSWRMSRLPERRSNVKATELGDVRAEDLLKFLYGDGEAIAKALPDLQLPDKAVASRAEALEEYQAMARDLAEEFQVDCVGFENFVGHVKTDLDSVAGALGAAALWRGTAARAEKELNGEIMQLGSAAMMPPYFDDIPGAVKPNDKGDKQMVPVLRDDPASLLCSDLGLFPNRKKRIVGLIDHHALAESMASETPENLQSVTTTNADRFIVTVLCILGECEDPDELARKMQGVIWYPCDQKDFTAKGWKVGIAVLEVTDTEPVLKVAEELDFAYLFVVDVTQQKSLLLVAGGRELALAKAAFPGKETREAKPGIRAPGATIKAQETLMDVGGP
ncbi:hypothetical protein AK812_SmicGene38891 [Symbiodinium microadriaticum]|uniref:Manganese-dependent inorganic pyrophosphatase n=1 Tax=Symbiodinium microadriaticum TaxID=2951 RepID=A0A1Q9CCL5_SYMMI|nr:hypothetical protein AK812_SmicGene38891 [Symbiodinium microadriaticum]